MKASDNNKLPSDFRVYELVEGLIHILVMVVDRVIRIVDGCRL